MATLVTYSGQTIPIGGSAELAGTEVEVVAFEHPIEEGDYGNVTIRHPWGANEAVDPARLGAYISLD